MFRKIDNNLLILLAGLILGGGLGLMATQLKRDTSPVNPSKSVPKVDLRVGAPEVDFTLETLSGESIRLSDLQGKPVVINFWATWCAPCELEMPFFQEVYEAYHPGLEVLAVNYNEPEAEIQSFIEKLNLTFPILLDPGGKIINLYQLQGFPTTFFIDREGIVQGIYIGTLSKSMLESYLKKIGVGE